MKLILTLIILLIIIKLFFDKETENFDQGVNYDTEYQIALVKNELAISALSNAEAVATSSAAVAKAAVAASTAVSAVSKVAQNKADAENNNEENVVSSEVVAKAATTASTAMTAIAEFTKKKAGTDKEEIVKKTKEKQEVETKLAAAKTAAENNRTTTQPPIQQPIVTGISSQYKTVGSASPDNLFYSTWCSNAPNKICYGEYRLRFSNSIVSPITLQTEAGLNQGLTDPSIRFKLSDIPSNGVTAILQIKNVANNSNDNKWYDVDVPSQFIKPPETELIFSGNTGQIKKQEDETKKPQMLYEFKEHTFTTAGKSGPQGPTLQEVKQAYSGVAWAQNNEFLNMTTQGIQEWKVPVTGSYIIRAVGAAGDNRGTNLFSRGRDIQLSTILTKGEVIKILVGQKGKNGGNAGSGGGGTFVVKDKQTPIIVAGGGGGIGANNNFINSNANNSTSGNNAGDGTGIGISNGAGGTNGNGGSGFYTSAGGGGLLGDGTINIKGEASFNGISGGSSFIKGGVGGNSGFIGGNPPNNSTGAFGGFGGGGGCYGNGGGGGGGGGYSGGGGGHYNDPIAWGSGGGGGSYGITSFTDNGAINSGDGSVTITLVDTNNTNQSNNQKMLYEFKEHKFTTAGKSGPQGPTLQEVKQAYSGVAWAQNSEFLNMTKQGIQEWKVPVTGTYKIQALGAASFDPLGYGRDISLNTTLTKGEVIKILVGQRPAPAGRYNGGAGGSFVVRDEKTAIIVAGGGGGTWNTGGNNAESTNSSAVLSNNGNNGGGNQDPGSGGAGGSGGNGTSYSAAGGGFLNNGMSNTAGNLSNSQGGLSFINGGTGGIDGGGFGGGGGGGDGNFPAGSGGGGYGGGGGGGVKNGNFSNGGGGGSYGITNLTDNGAINKADGSVTITLIDTNQQNQSNTTTSAPIPALYAFTSHTFTTAGKTGREGPTLQEVKQAYSGVAWTQNSEFLNMTKQGIQEWKVPITGNYKIRAIGAGSETGRGMDASITTTLTKDEVIKILVGQQSNKKSPHQVGLGGAGGTFVVRGTQTPIIVTGGSGGRGATTAQEQSNATINNTGQTGLAHGGNGAGGVNGGGGSPTNNGSGGGGLIGDGTTIVGGQQGGRSFINGGLGGSGNASDGGFGGGGGCATMGGSGGGGYSGGGGAGLDPVGLNSYLSGGGGGSYSITGKFDSAIANNGGDGSVTITLIDTNQSTTQPPTKDFTNIIPSKGMGRTMGLCCSNDGKYVYQSTIGVIYGSDDYGKNFKAFPIESTEWHGISCDPSGANIAVSSWSGKVYVSFDYGNNWKILTTTQYGGGTYISSNKKFLYYYGPGGLILRATGDGYTIIETVLNLNNLYSFWPKCRMASSENGNIKYITGGGHGTKCYMSKDSDQSWQEINLEAGVYQGVACSSDGSIAYFVGANGKLYQSTDTGVNWKNIQDGKSWYSVCCSADGKKVFIGGDVIRYSFDSGKSWKELKKTQIWQQNIARDIMFMCCSNDGTMVYFADNQGGIYYLD
jgi:hypothetical protein